MHPMFAELFIKPDDALEADERHRLRRSRRSRRLSTVHAARSSFGAARTAQAGHRAP